MTQNTGRTRPDLVRAMTGHRPDTDGRRTWTDSGRTPDGHRDIYIYIYYQTVSTVIIYRTVSTVSNCFNGYLFFAGKG
jgi:hypothetical protein